MSTPHTAAIANELKLNQKHFEMLRIAKVRGLKVRRIDADTYAVTSHTRRADGFEWTISHGACFCPSRDYCTHLAAAVDFYFTTETDGMTYADYNSALIADRLLLRFRIRSGEMTRSDKIYLAYCERFYRAKVAAAKVTAPPVTETVVHEGGRTRTVTRCGSFVI